MTMKCIFSLFVLILIFCTELVFTKERYNPLEFEVSLKKSNKSIFLDIKLTNKGKIIPFPVYSDLLPWEDYLLFQLVAIPFIKKNDNIIYQKMIKGDLEITHPFSKIEFIFPGKTIEGRIALSDLFSNETMNSLKQKNVLICWGYSLLLFRLDEKINSHWYQGYVISQTQDSEKLLISKMLEETFNEKCSTVLVPLGKD
jgi:hypothetical protein